jgi:hypothetical protein
MQNINASNNSPRSVAEHPNILSDRTPSGIFQGLSTLPRLLPRNAISVRLPDFMDQALNISPIRLNSTVNRTSTDSNTNASANGTYVATSRTSNPSGPLPNFPQL